MGGVDAGCWQNRVISFLHIPGSEKETSSEYTTTQSKGLKQYIQYSIYNNNTALHIFIISKFLTFGPIDFNKLHSH